MSRRSTTLSRFFAGWLLALAAFAALLFWARASLDAHKPAAPEVPGAAAASGAGEISGNAKSFSLSPSPETSIPPFDADAATHLVTAFPMQGVHQIDDAAPAIALFPPESSLTAQVIERESQPQVRTEKVTVRYRLDDAYAGGRNKDAASGDLAPDKDRHFFASDGIGVTPYASDTAGAFQPYPVARVEALDDEGGALLASTGVVLPVSSETGCRNCHGGPWKNSGKDGAAGGISEATVADILAVHDRRNATELADMVKQGATVQCASCHSGLGDEPNLSTAVHGFHATMDLGGGEACGLCHASSEGGPTQFYRGYHNLLGLDCTRCHGALTDHAISLLRHESERGSPAAGKRLGQLRPAAVADVANVKPREPGVNLPQCAGCHDFKTKPDFSTATAFNKWTQSEDERFTRAFENMGKVRCPSCHGAPHAVYPASNPAGDDRDNIQPLQYQGAAMPLGKDGNCAVCHTHDMPFFVHHDTVE